MLSIVDLAGQQIGAAIADGMTVEIEEVPSHAGRAAVGFLASHDLAIDVILIGHLTCDRRIVELCQEAILVVGIGPKLR